MSTYYIDESAGSDTTGHGTQDSPYQSLAHALFAHSSDQITLRIKKDKDWEEPTQSSLKKARKTADGLEKKRKKLEEVSAAEEAKKKEEAEKRERMLDESRRVVLREDEALPKALRVGSVCLYSIF